VPPSSEPPVPPSSEPPVPPSSEPPVPLSEPLVLSSEPPVPPSEPPVLSSEPPVPSSEPPVPSSGDLGAVGGEAAACQNDMSFSEASLPPMPPTSLMPGGILRLQGILDNEEELPSPSPSSMMASAMKKHEEAQKQAAVLKAYQDTLIEAAMSGQPLEESTGAGQQQREQQEHREEQQKLQDMLDEMRWRAEEAEERAAAAEALLAEQQAAGSSHSPTVKPSLAKSRSRRSSAASGARLEYSDESEGEDAKPSPTAEVVQLTAEEQEMAERKALRDQRRSEELKRVLGYLEKEKPDDPS